MHDADARAHHQAADDQPGRIAPGRRKKCESSRRNGQHGHKIVGTTEPQRDEILQRTSEKLLRVADRSEEHTSELQSLMRISYAVFCLKKKKTDNKKHKQ